MRRDTHQFNMREKWPNGLPQSFDVIMGMDYGLRAPYCAVWIAVDHNGDLWAFREDYEKGLTATEQAQRVIDKTARNESIRYVYADPHCWDDVASNMGHASICTADYYRRYFDKDDRFGPLLKGFNKSRRAALDTLDALLTRGNGYRNLWIEEHMVNGWREMTEAIWDTRGVNGIKEDIDPGCADHFITALYYACHTHISAPSEKSTALPTWEEIRRMKQERIAKDEYRAFNKRVPGGPRRFHRV